MDASIGAAAKLKYGAVIIDLSRFELFIYLIGI